MFPQMCWIIFVRFGIDACPEGASASCSIRGKRSTSRLLSYASPIAGQVIPYKNDMSQVCPNKCKKGAGKNLSLYSSFLWQQRTVLFKVPSKNAFTTQHLGSYHY
mmetsp:Transcript_30933/g.55559  ORF Transcript_30933/g.55559 Transcript_30933/m.55559 type:complete len:105 (+) Transcript_30933:32-346(+)